MTRDETAAVMSSQRASTLHARLCEATRTARAVAVPVAPADASPRRTRRFSAAAAWTTLAALRQHGAADATLSVDRALRRVLATLLEQAGPGVEPASFDVVNGPIVVVRSGPWPVLRALLQQLPSPLTREPITLLCHKRDLDLAGALVRELSIELVPLVYPRFEPFSTTVLRRLLSATACDSLFVLDGSTSGRGDALEHVVAASPASTVYVWNAGGLLCRRRSLEERLGREDYALVRGLLRWRAARG